MIGNGPHTSKITRELLEKMYLIDKMKMDAIANYFGCSVALISKRVKYFNLKKPTSSKYIDRQFGKLIPIEIAGKNKYRTKYKCECECGRFIEVDSCSLITGNTTSCGCDSRKRGKEHPYYKGYEEISSSIWSSLKRGAMTRNLNFSVTIEEVWNLYLKQNKKCALTGLNIDFASTRRLDRNGRTTASLDRIDSTKGYISGNIQWVHKDVNIMKSNFAQNRFIEICKLVSNYRK